MYREFNRYARLEKERKYDSKGWSLGVSYCRLSTHFLHILGGELVYMVHIFES